MGNEKWEMGIRKWEMGIWKWEVGNSQNFSIFEEKIELYPEK